MGGTTRPEFAYHNWDMTFASTARRVPGTEPAPTGARPDACADPCTNPWLLLIHSIPPKPDYFRVKIGRRLQRLGAAAIKNSVYALPNTDATYEDFQWLLREIIAGGGEASLCEASFMDGILDEGVRAMFDEARNADYRGVAAEARLVIEVMTQVLESAEQSADRRRHVAAELVKLHRRLKEIQAIDFFDAPERVPTQSVLSEVEAMLRPKKTVPRSGAGEQADGQTAGEAIGLGSAFRGRTWVTRRGVHVDRIASAWLIRRFIDPDARFKFVAPKGYVAHAGELRFDMFEAEYTHEGSDCTFEILLKRFHLGDPALVAVAEIVHDIDYKESRFGREETAGVASLIHGIALPHTDDVARLESGSAVFDGLYHHFHALSRAERT